VEDHHTTLGWGGSRVEEGCGSERLGSGRVRDIQPHSSARIDMTLARVGTFGPWLTLAVGESVGALRVLRREAVVPLDCLLGKGDNWEWHAHEGKPTQEACVRRHTLP